MSLAATETRSPKCALSIGKNGHSPKQNGFAFYSTAIESTHARKVCRSDPKQTAGAGRKPIHIARSNTQSSQSFEVLLLPDDEVVIVVRFSRDGVESPKFGLLRQSIRRNLCSGSMDGLDIWVKSLCHICASALHFWQF